VTFLPGLAVWRHALRHPLQLALAVLGIGLGVGVVVSIDLANASAERAFALSAEGVAGRATHRLVGGDAGVPESLYTRLRRERLVPEAAPVVEGHVGVVDRPGQTFLLLGVDPFAERAFRQDLTGPGGWRRAPLVDLMTRPGTLLVGAAAPACMCCFSRL
jgi:putative ABC transport system permease protein